MENKIRITCSYVFNCPADWFTDFLEKVSATATLSLEQRLREVTELEAADIIGRADISVKNCVLSSMKRVINSLGDEQNNPITAGAYGSIEEVIIERLFRSIEYSYDLGEYSYLESAAIEEEAQRAVTGYLSERADYGISFYHVWRALNSKNSRNYVWTDIKDLVWHTTGRSENYSGLVTDRAINYIKRIVGIRTE